MSFPGSKINYGSILFLFLSEKQFKSIVVRFPPLNIVYSFFAAALMLTVYDQHKDGDGFLYLTYSGDNTFG